MIKQYRKKPLIVNAIEFNGFNFDEIAKFTGLTPADMDVGEIRIKTLEGIMRAGIGDFIIKGIIGEFYPCKPDAFEKTYEEVK